MSDGKSFSKEDALEYHWKGGKRPGKLALALTVPLSNQRDLSLAYSPGVASPCLEIHKDPQKVYNYTSKGNTVAVITNGTSVLGMGNIGALASKPVMEGKAALFKKFADIDAVDIEVDSKDPEEFINIVKCIGESWGGINLEDIKSPECFNIENRLKDIMNIPVFHDDQHGTSIVAAAGLINAADISGRKMSDLKVVFSGAGAAAKSCVDILRVLGVEDITVCDLNGVIYKGRDVGMNPWKLDMAVETKSRTLADALIGANVFFGLSVANVLTSDMLSKMAIDPIVFAMANPDPEAPPELIKSVHSNAIIATGRSDYNNQVNNALCFPYVFRGALDTRASIINEQMKLAAVHSIAELARKPVSDEVLEAYSGSNMLYGPDYIIPTPLDPRLITNVPVAVAKAAMDSGVAKNMIDDMSLYIKSLETMRF